MNHGEGHFGVGQEALEEGMVTHFSRPLPGELPTDREEPGWATAPTGSEESDMAERLITAQHSKF